MRTTRTTRVCVGDAPCTRAPTRTRAPRRTRCATPPAVPAPPPIANNPPAKAPRSHQTLPMHGLPADHPAHGPRSASRRRPRPPMPCLCPPRACALPTAPPPAHRKPTPAPFTPNPDTRPSATRAWPSLGVAPAPTPAHAVPLCPPPARALHACAAPLPSRGTPPACRHSALHSLLRPCAARPLPSLPSHGDAPAPGARPAVALPAARCPPPARALHACTAPLPSHGVAPAPGPGARLPRPSPPPARCPPSLSRIPMGAPQPGEGSPPEDGRPTR